MRLVADLHVHSKYSRATSRDLDLVGLHRAALRKGISIVATGDCVHPGWRQELHEQLEPAEPGLYRLKSVFRRAAERDLPTACQGEVRFILEVEISNIYKKNGRTRKNHNLVFLPSFEAAQKLADTLASIGNIQSDGRPILGLDARTLLEITLDCDPLAFLIPAHVWTPWFSMLGSQSGFDSLEECFADLSDQIFAVETGLSSDPPMNWRLSALDRVALISNSDAHSANKLGREANVLDIDLGYEPLLQALRTRQGLLGTVEFFPEEGKYHADGHRKCGVRLTPEQTRELGGRCPACGGSITVGVLSRVVQLADRALGFRPPGAAGCRHLVPLAEVVAQVCGTGPESGRVRALVEHLLESSGPELSVLENVPLEDLRIAGGSAVAEAIRRVRSGEVTTDAGYDGQYGTVRLFDPSERDTYDGQLLLGCEPERQVINRPTRLTQPAPLPALPLSLEAVSSFPPRQGSAGSPPLDQEQERAVRSPHGPLLIVAGPGTGKTRTIVARICHFITSGDTRAEEVLAITFTNQAALELRNRLERELGGILDPGPTVTTFHGFGAGLLREAISESFELLDDDGRLEFVREALGEGATRRDAELALARFSIAKQCCDPRAQLNDDPSAQAAFDRYQALLRTRGRCDVDDLVLEPVRMLAQSEPWAARIRRRHRLICVDEFQDVNDVQAALIRLLMPTGEGLCVIGDPDQAIYGFRGARPGHFQRFAEVYEQTEIVHLKTTYRLTEPILRVAESVLSKRRALRCEKAGSRVEIVACPTPESEAEQILVRVERLVGGTSLFAVDSGRGCDAEARDVGFGDIAILTRTRAQHRVILEALGRSGIPCRTVGEDEPHDPRSEKIALMTLHASKGREFEVVFVAGVESGILPLEVKGLSTDPDEERRLLYVGITRARRLCILSFARKRTLYGKLLPGEPSRLLRDLPRAFVSSSHAPLPDRPRPAVSAQLSLFED